MRRIGDRFVVEEPLGAGGMGSIFRGRDERLGGPVAIKFLKRAHGDDPVLRERFRREARALANVRHPGIVGVLDFGEADGELYTVLELVDGDTLEALLREGPLSQTDAASIADQILAALEVCHEAGVVHRDIKPANLLVSREERHVTIIDFGLARTVTEEPKLTDTGVVQGTPQYMAPEQCRGDEVGSESDVYAMGIVLYEMLAGTTPFRGNDAATFMAQHLFVDARPLDELVPHVSRGVAETVQRALAKQPNDRPTARELRAALASAFAGTDPQTHAAAAITERRRMGALERRERVLGSHDAPEAAEMAGTVLVWVDRIERNAELRSALGAAGVTTAVWTGDSPPPASSTPSVVILSAREGLHRIGLFRCRSVAVDIASPDETTAAIRAGADDMLLVAAPDADLAPKVRRLLRRGPR